MAGSRFDLQKFSLSASDTVANEEISIYASLEGQAGSALEVHVDTLQFSVSFKGSAHPVGGVLPNPEMYASFHGHVVAAGQINEYFEIVADLWSEAGIGADIYGGSDAILHLNANAELYAKIGFSSDTKAELTALVSLGAICQNDAVMAAILSTGADLAEYREEVFLLNVELPVGSELRIDTENYTVTLDGENILHLQEGEWLSLSRGLISAHVDNGTAGDINGSLIYRERWL